jgi:hypothetical protein
MVKANPASAASAQFRYLTDLSLAWAARVSEAYVGPGHMVSSMVAFGVGILVLLSAGIFLAHVIAAYRAE